MTTPFTYDFGYSWPVAWGHAVPAVVFAVLLGLALWRHWPAWLAAIFGVVTAWAVTAVFAIQVLLGINLPVRIPSAQFMPGGAGRVLDIGAGSGRATIGLLLARPGLRVTAVDIYSGYYGIDDNTPGRLLENARRAGVGDRVEVKVGDARQLPFEAATFDGAISTYAIDHMNWQGTTDAVQEVVPRPETRRAVPDRDHQRGRLGACRAAAARSRTLQAVTRAVAHAPSGQRLRRRRGGHRAGNALLGGAQAIVTRRVAPARHRPVGQAGAQPLTMPRKVVIEKDGAQGTSCMPGYNSVR